MADQRKALDEKTKKLSRGGEIKEGKESSEFQQSQQQLLAIQAEQQQNLAVARAESKASSENNQMLAQAAELGAASAAEAEQAALMGTAAAPQLNPATQAILSKYGVGQPQFQRSQTHNQQVTKQNITINNNTTVNTTNDVKVPANIGGPLQGRPLQFKASSSGDSMGKFKAWISSVFAKQNEEGAKRDREYRNRENSLTRSANKMMKKLESIGETIGTRMDPRRIGSTIQSQLKTLFFLFGFGYLTANWNNLLVLISGIEKWFKEDVASFFGIGKYKNQESKLVTGIRDMFGGRDGESVGDAIKNFFTGDDGLYGLLKTFFSDLAEERGKAMKMIELPDIDLGDMVGSLKNIAVYIGDLLLAMTSGSSGVKSHINHRIKAIGDKGAKEQIKKDKFTTETENFKRNGGIETKANVGVNAILNNKYLGLTKHSLDSDGELTTEYGAESTVAQASDLKRIVNKANETGKIDNVQFSAGLSRLMRAAKKSEENGSGGIPVGLGFRDLLKNWLSDKEIKDLEDSGDIKNKVPYLLVLRKKTEKDKILDGTSVAGALANSWAELYATDVVTDHIGPAGTVIKGKKTLDEAGNVIGTVYRNAADDADYRLEAVKRKRPGDILLPNGKGGVLSRELLEITPKVIQKVADNITESENTEVDLTNKSLVEGSQQSLVNIALKNLEKDEEELDRLRKEEAERGNRSQGYLESAQNSKEYFRVKSRVEAKRRLKRGEVESDYGSDIKKEFEKVETLRKDEEEREKRRKEALEDNRVLRSYNNNWNATFGRAFHKKKLQKEQKILSEYTIKRLGKEGLSLEQASGIIGNLLRESDLNPTRVNPNDNGSPSKGIAQWHGKRIKDAEDYLKQNYNVNSLEKATYDQQLEFLIHEMKNNSAGSDPIVKNKGFKSTDKIIEVMKSTKDVNDAANTFERIFEVSADYDKEGNATRIGYARSVYKANGGELKDDNLNFKDILESIGEKFNSVNQDIKNTVRGVLGKKKPEEGNNPTIKTEANNVEVKKEEKEDSATTSAVDMSNIDATEASPVEIVPDKSSYAANIDNIFSSFKFSLDSESLAILKAIETNTKSSVEVSKLIAQASASTADAVNNGASAITQATIMSKTSSGSGINVSPSLVGYDNPMT